MRKLVKEKIDELLSYGFRTFYMRSERFTNVRQYNIGDISITKSAPWLHILPFLVYKYELSIGYDDCIRLSRLDGIIIYYYLKKIHKAQRKKEQKETYNNVLEKLKGNEEKKTN